MRPRLRVILDVLLSSDSWTPVHELARAAGAGVRTVFRDVLELEYILKPYGVDIEKKRGIGIRLSGDLSSIPGRERSLAGRLPWLTAEQRAFALVCYLGHERRVFKLTELALLFGVSDSCVSGDLREAEANLARWSSGAVLSRMKGIGISLEGGEWAVRTAVLHAAVHLMDPRDIVRSVQQSPSQTDIARVLRTLGYAENPSGIFDAVRKAELDLGYHFSWFDQGLLWIYLVIALQRRTEAGYEEPSPFADTVFSVPSRVSVALLSRLSPAPNEAEVRFLSGVLSSLESGELRDSLRSHPAIPDILTRFIASLDKRMAVPLLFDRTLLTFLSSTLSAQIYKKILGLPMQPAAAMQKREGLSDILDDAVADDLIPLIERQLGAVLDPEDLFSFSLTLYSAVDASSRTRQPLRVLISCFEGICLAQFISSLISARFPELAVAGVRSCGRSNGGGYSTEQADFIITTFPSSSPHLSEFAVPLPFEPEEFCRSLALFLAENPMPGRAASTEKKSQDQDTAEPDDLVDAAVELIGSFVFSQLNAPVHSGGETREIARLAASDGLSAKRLKSDLDRRESYGAVVLENTGIRLFHCRSRAAGSPRFGVVRNSANSDVWVFMIAPEPASKRDISMLSRISVALMDDLDFSRVIVSGQPQEIKRSLFQLFADFL
ncbi:MAG TPA: hypothetical protein PL077_00715 [Treponemataceae bacterium]|nr:hypothetical protein [Treponemataceae bacterium]